MIMEFVPGGVKLRITQYGVRVHYVDGRVREDWDAKDEKYAATILRAFYDYYDEVARTEVISREVSPLV